MSVASDLRDDQPMKWFDQMNQNKLDFEHISALAQMAWYDDDD